MLPLIVRRKFSKYVIPLVSCAVLVVASIDFLTAKPFSVVTYAVLIVCGGASIALAKVGASRAPILIVDRHGILYPDWQIGTVPWEDFREVYIKEENGTTWVCFLLRRPDAYRNQAGKMMGWVITANRTAGFGDVALNSANKGLDAHVLLEIAETCISKAGLK